MTHFLTNLLLFILTICLQTSTCLELDLKNRDSIKAACSIIARNTMTFYTGKTPGATPGVLPKPAYWWQAGALWGQLIDYWSYTGDTTYNDIVTESLLYQIGPNKAFMPENVTKEEGNDDQSFWAFAAMNAAELMFPEPKRMPVGPGVPFGNKPPSWIALAQAVFNTQIARWDTDTCGGGLRWQIFFTNAGYDYKNTISNAALFQLSARLARYTGNTLYENWADKIWDWLASTPNLEAGTWGMSYAVNDGSAVKFNCTDTNHDQWTYNYGALIMGSAYMYNMTIDVRQQIWEKRLNGLLDKFFVNFFPREHLGRNTTRDIMVEIHCEGQKTCDADQTSFKGLTSRWLAVTTQLAPFTSAKIMPRLKASANGAARQCSGGEDKTWCGQNWNAAEWDGFRGLGEQMSALAVIGATLMEKSEGQRPVTESTGGTSKNDPTAGTTARHPYLLPKIKTGDTIGASILTAAVSLAVAGMGIWIFAKD